MTDSSKRVVITGLSVITPLGNTVEKFWEAIQAGRSGVEIIPPVENAAPAFRYGGFAHDFTGHISEFGPLDATRKKAIRKGLKLMCREIKMGVAAAQLALHDSALAPGDYDPDRVGAVFGCDHIVTEPEEFTDAFNACLDDENQFEYARWAAEGIGNVTPLWLLKYLPNMPASHVAIYNELRGPNNSLTYREPSSNLAISEAATTILRGSADRMIAGTTGCGVGPLRSLQVQFQADYAVNGDDPATAIRPFDANRTGTVAAEGAAAIVLERLDHAQQRNATIHGEIIGYGSGIAVDAHGVADIRAAVRNTVTAALKKSGLEPGELGHIHAHGLGTVAADAAEAAGIRDAIGDAADTVPVTAAKSYFGNLGAASGMVELIASMQALKDGTLFPILSCQTPDPDCRLKLATCDTSTAAGTNVLNVNFSPNGQASAVIVALPS